MKKSAVRYSKLLVYFFQINQFNFYYIPTTYLATMFRQKRLQNEEQNLIENQDQLPVNLKFRKESQTKYLLQYTGEKGSLHDGAYIVCELDLTNFPDGAPIVTFRNDFKHVNVYPMGKLCLYLINAETWTSGTTLVEIFNGINTVIHHPTFDDPANSQVLVKEGNMGHDEKMRQQAQRLKDPKYKVL